MRAIRWFFPLSSTTFRFETPGEGRNNPPPGRSCYEKWPGRARVNVPGRLDTAPSALSRSLVVVWPLPLTRTPLHVGAKCDRPHRGLNRALTTGFSVELRRFRPLGHGGGRGRRLSKKGGAVCRHFWHTLSYIFSAHVVKIADPGHARSGHQVTSSDLTS